MKAFLVITFTFCAVLASVSNAQNVHTANDVQSRKLICVIENAAGVIYASQDAKEPTPKAINFEERHKKFVLTIKQIVRGQEQRDMCRSNLEYWMAILAEKGTFDPSDKPNFSDIKKSHDYRGNIGPFCFASNEATIKFFDRDFASRLVGYDFLQPDRFESTLPGEWLGLYGNNFEAGELLDAGPVVFTGKCERID